MKTRCAQTCVQENPAEAGSAVQEAITLDYPKEGEVINSAGYTFRIHAPSTAEVVELCINRGPWQLCRYAGEYWWYDWAGFKAGGYLARARMRTGTSRFKTTLPRNFHVGKTAAN